LLHVDGKKNGSAGIEGDTSHHASFRCGEKCLAGTTISEAASAIDVPPVARTVTSRLHRVILQHAVADLPGRKAALVRAARHRGELAKAHTLT
jgi:hypothetical protein